MDYRRLATERRSPCAPSRRKIVGRKIAAPVSSSLRVNPRHDKAVSVIAGRQLTPKVAIHRAAPQDVNQRARSFSEIGPFFGQTAQPAGPLVLTFTLDHVGK